MMNDDNMMMHDEEFYNADEPSQDNPSNFIPTKIENEFDSMDGLWKDVENETNPFSNGFSASRETITQNSIPCKGKNGGLDNSDSDLIIAVNDVVRGGNDDRYKVVSGLGHGTFGQVVKCSHYQKGNHVGDVAVKIIKNKPAYYNQALVEIRILSILNENEKQNGNSHNVVRLLSYFEYKNHLHLVFEILSINLYDLIKKNKFRGLSMEYVHKITEQLLDGLELLASMDIVHCDLKPENILLEQLDKPRIRLIDFGSSCFKDQTVYTYIQSRFYRAPEVLVGLPYNNSIDMWSLGCIAVELYMGLPVFPGASEHNQLFRIIEMLGAIPDEMLERGKNTSKFFVEDIEPSFIVDSEIMVPRWVLKTAFEWARDQNLDHPEKNVRYFKYRSLKDICLGADTRDNDDLLEDGTLMYNRRAFLDFVNGLLRIHPQRRWTAWQARSHPFITRTQYTKPFVPMVDPRAVPHLSVYNSRFSSGTHPGTPESFAIGSYVSLDGDAMLRDQHFIGGGSDILSPMKRPVHPNPLAHVASWDKRKFMNCSSRAHFFENHLNPLGGHNVASHYYGEELLGTSCPAFTNFHAPDSFGFVTAATTPASGDAFKDATNDQEPYSAGGYSFSDTDDGLALFKFSPELPDVSGGNTQ